MFLMEPQVLEFPHIHPPFRLLAPLTSFDNAVLQMQHESPYQQGSPQGSIW